MVPCLFTWPEQFHDLIIFALHTPEGICPVRGIPINRVQDIRAERKTLPTGFRIHLMGDDAMRLLSELDMLAPMLHAMAEDIANATKRMPRRKADKAAFEAQLHEVGEWNP